MGFMDSFRRGLERSLQQQQQQPPAPLPLGPVDTVFAPQVDIVVNGSVSAAHEGKEVFDAPPPALPRRSHRVMDVPGTWTRGISGIGNFEDILQQLPLGPVLVTMRLEPNEANPYGVSAYVSGQQVGWLGTEWKASDPWVRWMKGLDEAGILPRFKGLLRLQPDGDRFINIEVPGKNDGRLGDIARRLIQEMP